MLSWRDKSKLLKFNLTNRFKSNQCRTSSAHEIKEKKINTFGLKIAPSLVGVGDGGTHYISMCMDVLKKMGLIFRVCLERRCVSLKKIWEGIQICLSGKGFMSVWKGVVNYFSLERSYHRRNFC